MAFTALPVAFYSPNGTLRAQEMETVGQKSQGHTWMLTVHISY